ncbi:hypothetical protein AYI70_g5711 [Smittium culicis]|uniref:Uncharacterized protein n=1 Tax=Smittium culicis TaxID=133412 RepID=A0A1R1XT58_9FUNG|nr:hypothetical protein AYI70_g5711 [Smittium culicis]
MLFKALMSNFPKSLGTQKQEVFKVKVNHPTIVFVRVTGINWRSNELVATSGPFSNSPQLWTTIQASTTK